MASASNAVRLCMLSCRWAPRQRRAHRVAWPAGRDPIARRAFSTSEGRWADEPPAVEEANRASSAERIPEPKMSKRFAELATPETLRQMDEITKNAGFNTIEERLAATLRQERPGLASEKRRMEDIIQKIEKGPKVSPSAFWYDEDDPFTYTEEFDDFDEDDITSMAHGKLDEIREMRHYARLAVWELPLLSKLAKPFEPPTKTQVLRWRYTTYMGDTHPAESKVVVQFAPDDLNLTPAQTEKLKKLVGSRYNPETELVKMSHEGFEHQAQNKRYLSNLVDDLVAAAKDPTDTFEDVPLDTRHHEFKTKPKFPKEWYLTEERRKELDAHWQREVLEEQKREADGLLVDGRKLVDESLMQKLIAEEETKKEKVAELVAAPRSRPGGGARARR